MLQVNQDQQESVWYIVIECLNKVSGQDFTFRVRSICYEEMPICKSGFEVQPHVKTGFG